MLWRKYWSLLFTLLFPALATSQAPTQPVAPKVVLIGDGIRLACAPLVVKRLAGRAEVVSPAEDSGTSADLLRHLHWVLREKPAIVHFSSGMHDLQSKAESGQPEVSLAAYQANLRTLVERLRKETHAQLVFANTTPVKVAHPEYREEDVRRYNAAALAVMKEFDVPVNDLHGLVEQEGTPQWQKSDGITFTAEGSERLAEAVADCLVRCREVVRARPRYEAPASNEQAGTRYRRAEAANDAQVPAVYKTLPVGTFPIPSSAAAWKAQRPQVLKTVLQALGDLPPRPAPQRVRLASRELHRDYTLERVAIENGAEGEVTALLLVPAKRRQPAPAILWLHSSTPDKNQLIRPNSNGGPLSLGETFVQAGYVVLAPDSCWYGDRAGTGPAGPLETYRGEPPVMETFLKSQDSLFKLNLWLGRTLWGMMVRDDQIALDYLCGRPEVDKTRIGATGMSMGSTRAWWLAAVDERIAATVAVACLTRYQNLIAHGQLRAHGMYYFVYGLFKHFDSEGVLALIAPRAFLALTGDLDSGSPADGIKVLEEKVGQVYGLTGAPDRFRSIIYPNLGHEYTPQMRTEMLDWFAKWLNRP